MFTTSQQRLFRKIELDIFDAAGKNDVASKVDKEGNYIFTPWNLSGEIITQIKRVDDIADKTFLVVDTIEIVPVLLSFGVNKCNITYVAPYTHKGEIARNLGVRVVQQSLLTWSAEMKFDVVIGNPPYLQGTWRTFMKKSIELSTQYVLLISPDGTIATSTKLESMTEILKNGGIQSVNACQDYFPGLVTSQPIVWYYFNKNIPYNSAVFDKTLTEEEKITLNIISKVKAVKELVGGLTQTMGGGKINKNAVGQVITLQSVTKSGPKLEMVDRNITRIIPDGQNFLYVNRFFGMNTEDTIYECTGEIGVSSRIYFVGKPAGMNAAEFKRIYLSKLMRFVLTYYRGTNRFCLGWSIRELPLIPAGIQDLYAHFNLTQEEINYIEETIK